MEGAREYCIHVWTQCGTTFDSARRTRFVLKKTRNLRFRVFLPFLLRQDCSIFHPLNIYPFGRCSRCWIWSNIRAFFWLCVHASYVSLRMRVSTGVQRNGSTLTARTLVKCCQMRLVRSLSQHGQADSQIIQRRLDRINVCYVHRHFYLHKSPKIWLLLNTVVITRVSVRNDFFLEFMKLQAFTSGPVTTDCEQRKSFPIGPVFLDHCHCAERCKRCHNLTIGWKKFWMFRSSH